ncbi:hypothetical protein CEXT_120941 [Caerostris extrusa]|uniref:Uncharacterized protein n=1 Tax=Caerostris extrusa TaxID=172846 RepID=A0AAV4V3G2_CAEEX|nr:hypothetical protein CEXT_120941 [Caerostris extrusa]
MGINAFWPWNTFSSSNADNSSLPVPCIIHVVSIVTHLQAHHMSQLVLITILNNNWFLLPRMLFTNLINSALQHCLNFS